MTACLALLLALTVQDPLALEAEEPDLDGLGAHAGLLAREIVRQAILIAGRDGLSLPTRDRALGETLPAEGALSVKTRVIPGKHVRVRLSRNGKEVWQKELALPGGDSLDLPALVEAGEAWSRTEFVDALKAAGYDGKPHARGPKGRVSDETERRLMDLTMTEQFAAAREIHRLCRTEGESPVRLGALVRAYAGLGEQAQGHMTAAHKVFRARALLYAERLHAAWPEATTGRWHRAYARALSGLHGMALAELAAAKPAEKEVVPPWVAWIDAYCRFDAPALAAAEAPYNRGFLKYLGYVTYERCGNPNLERARALDALQASPESYRLYEALCEVGGISNLHEATTQGPRTLATHIYGRLRSLPGLPEAALKAIEGLDKGVVEADVRPRVWTALLQDPDAGDPSWGALGRLIQETTFVQAWRRGDFMAYKWSVPTADYVKEVEPLIADHPYANLIRSYGLHFGRQKREWAELFKDARMTDVGGSFRPLINATWELDPGTRISGKTAWNYVDRHRDPIASDLEEAMRFTDAKDHGARAAAAREILAVSPHSPRAIRELIHADWDAVADKADAWEKSLAHHPQVLQALGSKYHALKRLDDAERCLAKVVATAPSVGSSRALANVYKERGQLDRWQATLDAFLTTEDVGLDHANVRVEIARHFMEKKEWAKAQPYAEAAAGSWAGWAMIAARDCYEGMGNLEKAHEWQKNTSERYDSNAKDWFLWCKRTGFGDVEAAQRLALAKAAEIGPRATTNDLQFHGVLLLLAGKRREGLEMFKASVAKQNQIYALLHVALLEMEFKNDAARDAALKSVAGYRPKDGEISAEAEVAKVLVAALAADNAPTPEACLALVKRQSTPANRANAAYDLGRFLELRGKTEDAKALYQASVDVGDPWRWNAILATEALRALK